MKNERNPRNQKALETRLAAAALDLAGKNGWEAVTHKSLARKCRIPSDQIAKMFPDTTGLLPCITRMIDDETTKRCGKIDPREPPRDRLFDAFMSRFDILQKYRPGILAIAKACRRSPGMAGLLLSAQLVSMAKMRDLAHFERKDVPGILCSVGLLAIYYSTLRVWIKKTDPDMESVMADLNRFLSKVEKWVGQTKI